MKMSKEANSYMRANTLSCVVELSLGKVTTVELRNESFVTGKVVEVDGFMNVTLQDVVFTTPSGIKQKFNMFFAPNRLIRYVQIPPEVDIKKGLARLLDKSAAAKTGSKAEFSLSKGRKHIMSFREKRQKEDLANAMKAKAAAIKASATGQTVKKT